MAYFINIIVLFMLCMALRKIDLIPLQTKVVDRLFYEDNLNPVSPLHPGTDPALLYPGTNTLVPRH